MEYITLKFAVTGDSLLFVQPNSKTLTRISPGQVKAIRSIYTGEPSIKRRAKAGLQATVIPLETEQ